MRKRRLYKILGFLTACLLVLSASAFFIFAYFTHRGYRMTVYLHGYTEILEGVWLDNDYDGDLDAVYDTVRRGRERVRTFYGEITSTPTIIITENEKKLKRLGGGHDIMTFAWGNVYSYVSIDVDLLDVDSVAHELGHAETHKRLYSGKITFGRGVPPWFDEGIALQMDYSSRYSWDALMECTANMTVLPDFNNLANEKSYYECDEETLLYNYIVSKYEVGRWLLENEDVEGLVELLEKLNHGGDFYELYDVPNTNADD